jgi:hypothetical protein
MRAVRNYSNNPNLKSMITRRMKKSRIRGLLRGQYQSLAIIKWHLFMISSSSSKILALWAKITQLITLTSRLGQIKEG